MRSFAAILFGALWAGSALAAPALPSGWSAGAPGPRALHADKPKQEVSAEALERMQRAARAARARAIDVDTLPTVAIARERPAGEIPTELPPGSAEDVVVLKAGAARRLNVAGFTAGVLSVNGVEAYFGRAGTGGIAGACGDGAKGRALKPMVYNAIRQTNRQGDLEFVMGRGFVETATCRVAIETRWSARPAKLARGLVLGFRTRCEACAEGNRDVLHLITPQLTGFFMDRLVPLEHHALPLEEGTSGVVSGFAGTMFGLSFTPPDWSDFSDRGCDKGSPSCTFSVRIEVSRGRGEAKATVLVKPALDAT